MKTRSYNFGAGPALLPESILQAAQAELLDWDGHGFSILEIGHRTPEFKALMAQAESDLRALLTIPDHYHVLFLGGAARTQFAMVPMNLLAQGQQAGYLLSGVWSTLAYEEACKLKQAYVIASSEDSGWTQAPDTKNRPRKANTAYAYYTPNETINGVRFASVPNVGDVPLVADMTSCLLSEPINVADYALIFAGAQKNIASAGLTLVIIRDDLLNRPLVSPIPSMLDYRIHASNQSLYATPPMFNCYLAAKMFAWIKAQGGVDALYQINCQKSEKLYKYIDASSFYTCHVEKNSRSLMNVCFSLARPELDVDFLAGAKRRGLYALQGHRLVGGMRASLYNAMPMAGVDALIAFMHDFSEEHHA